MKKLAVVSQWGWPPTINAQIIRLASLVKHLPEYGWIPIVIARKTKNDDLKDYDSYGELSGVRTYYYDGFLPPKNKLNSVLRWFFISDVFLIDLLYNFRKIERIIKKENPDVILVSTPPSGFILGHLLEKKIGIPIIVDYADPWTLSTYHRPPTKLHGSFFRYMDKKIFSSSDEIIGASYLQLKKMNDEFKCSRKVTWVPNGFDEKEFSSNKNEKTDDTTVFLYLGSVYRQFDLHFLRLFREFWEENPSLRSKFKLKFIGMIAPSKEAEIKKIGGEFTEVLGWLPIQQYIEERNKADILIFSKDYRLIDNFPMRVPEYMRTNKPIMAFTHKDSISGKILSKGGTAFFFEESEKDKAKEFIREAINGGIKVRANMDYIMQFEWGQITKKLWNVLEVMVNEYKSCLPGPIFRTCDWHRHKYLSSSLFLGNGDYNEW